MARNAGIAAREARKPQARRRRRVSSQLVPRTGRTRPPPGVRGPAQTEAQRAVRTFTSDINRGVRSVERGTNRVVGTVVSEAARERAQAQSRHRARRLAGLRVGTEAYSAALRSLEREHQATVRTQYPRPARKPRLGRFGFLLGNPVDVKGSFGRRAG